jgi:CBS domain-containing protein
MGDQRSGGHSDFTRHIIFPEILSETGFAGLDVICVIAVFFGFFSMEPSKSKPNTKEVVEAKPVKEIAERAVSLETKAPVKSAVDQLNAQGLEAAPVTDPEGALVGKISKDRMIRGVSGRGHDPQTTQVEPEVEKEGEPYCYEHESFAKAEEVMRKMKVDSVSVVSKDKKLIGKATRGAIEEERLKAENGNPRTES